MQQISTVGLERPMLGWPITRQGMLASWCMGNHSFAKSTV
jgi:hypothetical protein